MRTLSHSVHMVGDKLDPALQHLQSGMDAGHVR